MRSNLEEFAYGNISPEAKYFNHISKHRQALDTLVNNREMLLQTIDENQKVVLQKYIDTQGEVQLTAIKNIICGYKLGLLMTAEDFLTSKDLVGEKEGF